MANCGLPGTAGFVGEWMVILAAVKFNFWTGLVAATALIWVLLIAFGCSSAFILVRLLMKMSKGLKDICAREFLVLALLAAATLYTGYSSQAFY